VVVIKNVVWGKIILHRLNGPLVGQGQNVPSLMRILTSDAACSSWMGVR
jgi:hypothetical protein